MKNSDWNIILTGENSPVISLEETINKWFDAALINILLRIQCIENIIEHELLFANMDIFCRASIVVCDLNGVAFSIRKWFTSNAHLNMIFLFSTNSYYFITIHVQSEYTIIRNTIFI